MSPVEIWDDFAARVDWPGLARGASTGLTILVLGGLSAPLASRVPVIGPPWLIITAVVAFAVAAWRIGDALTPAVHGATAALVSYLLVLPLVVLGTGGLDVAQLGLTTVTALVVGGLVGVLAGRRRGY